MEENTILKEAIYSAKELEKKAPKIEGIPSGVKGLDELFFISTIKNGKPEKQILKGYPRYAIINITGVSDTGKSLMAEQFVIQQASLNHPILFVTVETTAPFVVSALKLRANAMNIEWEKIENHIILLDAASYDILREDINSFLQTLAYIFKEYKVKYIVIDSITGLYESKEMMARTIVRKIYNFLKKWYITGIFVSQKRSGHEEFSAEGAGGYAVPHIVDCNIVLGKKTIQSTYDERIYHLPIGEEIRLFRIDGCRICGHDVQTHLLFITDTGLVEIGPTLKELQKNSTKLQKK
ncbi:MAG: KaiC domain-containing protein [Leptospiraceae bacterium]|nr:MAG: KaiC domain-containing protein [Leptospiraceae bacterium]